MLSATEANSALYARWDSTFQKRSIGYGYHCFYAFIWLALLFAVTILIAVFSVRTRPIYRPDDNSVSGRFKHHSWKGFCGVAMHRHRQDQLCNRSGLSYHQPQ